MRFEQISKKDDQTILSLYLPVLVYVSSTQYSQPSMYSSYGNPCVRETQTQNLDMAPKCPACIYTVGPLISHCCCKRPSTEHEYNSELSKTVISMCLYLMQ